MTSYLLVDGRDGRVLARFAGAQQAVREALQVLARLGRDPHESARIRVTRSRVGRWTHEERIGALYADRLTQQAEPYRD